MDDERGTEETEGGEEARESNGGSETQDVTAPGDWERKPADEEELRHDDGSEPLAKPLGEEEDDDLAEQEAGDVSASDDDEDFDRPDTEEEAGLEDTGGALEEHGEPLLQGSAVKTPVGGVPVRTLVAMAAFVVIFCLVFFLLWELLGNFGILLGIILGVALGLGAMKLLADRERGAA
ncbi:MAG: mechanosensitive ion channel family protein [Actinomycetota bacterium]|nr:mechanosensitive ion channel family protein [Actinomycetota bacterium]